MTTVLVADDDDGYAAALADGLALTPEFQVVGRAGTATEVVSATASLAPMVVVLDARMPGGSVDEMIDGILAAAPRTAIVVVSGMLGPRLRSRLTDRGIASLDKADGLDVITATVRAALGRA
jgi:DNA-binding NarL/FixJ family response regulator